MWTPDEELDDEEIATYSRLIAMLSAFRGMTQDELAGAAGVTQPTVSDLYCEKRKSRAGTIEQLLRGLDVEAGLVDDLLRWIRRARASDGRRATPQSRRKLVKDAAAELTDALEEFLDATAEWIEVRRAEGVPDE